MTGKKLEIISQIVLWYETSFRIDCEDTYFCEAWLWYNSEPQVISLPPTCKYPTLANLT